MYPQIIIISSILTAFGYTIFVFKEGSRLRSRFIRSMWILGWAILVGLLILNVLYAQPDPEELILDFDALWSHIHFDLEISIPNLLSSALSFAICLLSALVFVVDRSAKGITLHRMSWFLLSILFAVMTIDEAIAPDNLHGLDILLLVYIACASLAGLSLVYSSWKAWKKSPIWQYIWLITGMGMIALGAVFIDKTDIPALGLLPGNVTMLEELLELCGILTIFIALLVIVYELVSIRLWRITQLALICFGIVILSGSVALLLRSPNIQRERDYLLLQLDYYLLGGVQYETTSYGDNLLTLMGFSLPEQPLRPGDVLQGQIYFRLEHPSSESYRFSAHLLSVPYLESVSQYDHPNIGDRPTMNRKAGDIFRQSLALTLPTVTEPSAYFLAVRLWSSSDSFLTDLDWQEWRTATEGLAIHQTTGKIINDELHILQLDEFIVIPQADSIPIEGNETRFTNGVVLTASIDEITAEAGDLISIPVQWFAHQAVSEDWIQIVHLSHQSTAELFVFDRPPFENRIPTSLWMGDFRATDHLHIHLPSDMPAGEYDLLTGLYNTDTLQRLAVDGGHENNIVRLGTVTVD